MLRLEFNRFVVGGGGMGGGARFERVLPQLEYDEVKVKRTFKRGVLPSITDKM